MICVVSNVGIFYASIILISTQLHDVLVKKIYLNSIRTAIPSCCTSFANRTKISSFSRTLPYDFRRMISDAIWGRGEVNCSLVGGEVLLTLFEPPESPSNRTRLVCGNTACFGFVCNRTGSGYHWAVFAGDDLAIRSSPFSAIANRQGALVATI
jgi:hypothetical protein